MIAALLEALSVFADPLAIGMAIMGALLGIIFGALPGWSPVNGLALVMPFTFGMDPMISMILFTGIIGGSHFGGSIPAILINTPGTAPNACTTFDGFPLAQKGEAVRALSISASCAFVGSMFGLAVLIIGIPIIRPFILSFMIPDYFWLTVFGLVTISFASRGNQLKGLAGGCIGVLLSLIGYSAVFAVERYTFGSYYLWDGVQLVPLVIGLFAISEIIVYGAKGGSISQAASSAKLDKSIVRKQVKQGIKDVFSRPLVILRSSAIGSVIGAIPGVGGSVANFLSYTVAMHNSSRPEEYGKGSIEGLVASETANDAKDGPAVMTTISFGVPGSPDTAVLMAALILHGLTPGPLLLRDDMPIVMMLFLGLLFSKIFTFNFGLATAGMLSRITAINVHALAPVVLLLCIAGAFALRQNIWDVLFAVVIGLIGYLLKRYHFSVITILIGYMLGEMAERFFYTSLSVGGGSYAVFVRSPISIALIILIFTMMFLPFVKSWLQRRKSRANGAEKSEQSGAAVSSTDSSVEIKRAKPWKSGEFIFTAATTAFVFLILLTSFEFSEKVRQIPVLVSSAASILLLGLLAGHFYPALMKRVDVGFFEEMKCKDEDQETKKAENESHAPAIRIILWIVGLFAAILLIGLKVSIFLFLLSFLWSEGKMKPWKALLSAAVGIAVFLAGMSYLGVDLWLGAIPSIIPGILGGSLIPRI